MEQPSETSSGTTSPTPTDDPAFDSLLRKIAHAPHASLEPSPGEVIAHRYELLTLLGRGGMGMVFSARDKRTLKVLALKWMTTGARGTASDHRAARLRFEREARIASRVAHSNLVDVYDVSIEEPSPFIVMELLHGETLRARIDRGRLSWDEALALLAPAMQGVAALHDVGVVHRDLKPDNIFLCTPKEGELPVAKVLDLGISRAPEGDGEAELLTKTGTVLGTPSYMPLEQLRGERDVGPTADVYALGVVLYEALSGVRPFRARTDADQAVLLATEGAMPLGERVPELAGARSDVVMRALARDPGDRYQSIAEMLRAFEGASARGWSARTRKLALACVVAIAIAAGVFGLASVWSTPEVEAGTGTAAVTEPARPVSRPPEEAQRAPATPSPVSEPAPAAPPIVSRQGRRIVDRSANQNIRRPTEGPAPEHHDPATLLRREEF